MTKIIRAAPDQITINQTQAPDHMTVIYVMAPDADGPCKIGYSGNLRQRLPMVQSGCWLPLAIFGVRLALSRKYNADSLPLAAEHGAKKAEASIHKSLRECGVGLHGEWFDVTAEEAIRAIEVGARLKNIAALPLDVFANVDVEDLGSLDSRLLAATKEHIVSDLCRINAFCVETVRRHGLDKVV